MSVCVYVGVVEFLRVCVYWLWFKKMSRMKGFGGWKERRELCF